MNYYTSDEHMWQLHGPLICWQVQ